jgi:regulator of cell morphogenesis and NO signaling
MNARLETFPNENFSLTAAQSLGQIAVHLPGATAVFRRLKLDFCCGGQISLAQAARDKGLDLQAVLVELAALQRPEPAPALTDPAALIDHILSRYHEVHRQQLPELVRMARRVEAVHRDKPEVPAGLAALLEDMEAELLSHMLKEEAILFPAIRSGSEFVHGPIAVMRAEHVEHGARLDGVLALTHGATPPAGACNTWRALYAGIAQLNDDLINHIHLENNLLFAHFDAPPAAQAGCGSNSGGCGCGCSGG